MNRVLVREFRARMAPLAALFGVIVALTPPTLYVLREQQRLEGSASRAAAIVATSLGEDATRHPRLWRYRIGKVVGRQRAARALGESLELRVRDCQGGALFASPGWRDDASSWRRGQAPVRARFARVGIVESQVVSGDLLRGALSIAAGSLPVGLGLGLLLFFFPVRVVRRQARALEDARRDLEVRVEDAVGEIEELSRELIVLQDTERERIARDLHDGVSQTLTTLRLELERRDDRGELERALELCERTLTELRRTIQDLRPVALERETLAAVIRDEAERFELTTGVAVFVRHTGLEAPRDPAWSVALLRILQEALHNVARHAGAEEVGVTLDLGDDGFRLEVRDDGAGFDPEGVMRGHGLRNMETRATVLGASFVLESAPGEGTRLCVAL